VKIVDVSNPQQTPIVGTFPRNSGIAVAVRGQYAYVAVDSFNSDQLYVVFVADPTNPLLVSQRPGTGRTITFHNDSLILAGAHMKIFDVSSPSNPTLTYDEERTFGEQAVVAGDFLYATSYNDPYVKVWDLSGPGDPVLHSYEFWDGDVLGPPLIVDGALHLSTDSAVQVTSRCAP